MFILILRRNFIFTYIDIVTFCYILKDSDEIQNMPLNALVSESVISLLVLSLFKHEILSAEMGQFS